MAVAIEFVNVIIRKSAVQGKYPGGLDGLARRGLSNYLEDDHLVRVGFMSSAEAIGLAELLEAAGLDYAGNGGSEVAVITGADEAAPSWLSVGERFGRRACWLSGAPEGELADFDPDVLLRLPRGVFPSLGEVLRAMRQGGADVEEIRRDVEGQPAFILDCRRESARVEVEVFSDGDAKRPAGLLARRDLARRASVAADVALLRDLKAALVAAGAET